MVEDLNVLIRRASAEGFTVGSLKAAAKKVQDRAVNSIPTGMQPGDGTWSTSEQIAQKVVRSTLYKGGYMYPGTDWGTGLNQYQAHAWTRPGESKDASPMAAVLEYLEALPLGAEVAESCDFGKGVSMDVYVKDSKGFRHARCMDESGEEALRQIDYVTPEAVAKEMGVHCSQTLANLLISIAN